MNSPGSVCRTIFSSYSFGDRLSAGDYRQGGVGNYANRRPWKGRNWKRGRNRAAHNQTMRSRSDASLERAMTSSEMKSGGAQYCKHAERETLPPREEHARRLARGRSARFDSCATSYRSTLIVSRTQCSSCGRPVPARDPCTVRRIGRSRSGCARWWTVPASRQL